MENIKNNNFKKVQKNLGNLYKQNKKTKKSFFSFSSTNKKKLTQNNLDDKVYIKCSNINKEYKDFNKKFVILKNINFEINKGEIAIILGPSGSGKTTLLNVMAGIDKANSGQCFVKGVDINSISDKNLIEIRKKYISYIYQRYGLVPIVSCYDNIRLGQDLVEKSKRVIDIKQVIDIVKINDILDKFPHEVSGGQRQRVAIARAIIKQPELMLCDEPTGALDSETSKVIIDLFLEINKIYKTTIVMVTHDTSLIRIASKVIYIKDGMIEKIDILK